MDILYKLTTDRMTSYIVSAQIFLIYIAGEEVRREKLCISLQMTSPVITCRLCVIPGGAREVFVSLRKIRDK